VFLYRLKSLTKAQQLNLLGVIVGGAAPGGIVLLINAFHPFLPRQFGEMPSAVFITFLVLFAFVTFWGWTAENASKEKQLTWSLRAGAGLSLLFLNGFVIMTGGPFLSPFSFHFLYVPVVVGRCLSPREMAIASIVCGVSFIVCSFVERSLVNGNPSLYDDIQTMGSDLYYLIAYGAVFFIQLWITYELAELDFHDRGSASPPPLQPADGGQPIAQ
jgi:hypothetical protein